MTSPRPERLDDISKAAVPPDPEPDFVNMAGMQTQAQTPRQPSIRERILDRIHYREADLVRELSSLLLYKERIQWASEEQLELLWFALNNDAKSRTFHPF